MLRLDEFIRGDWPARAITTAQILIGVVALEGLIAALTLSPYFLLGFASDQVLIFTGVGLFIIGVLFSDRGLVMQRYARGQVIFNEGDPGRDVYVIRSGEVEILLKRLDGSQEAIDRLGPGGHFGDISLLVGTSVHLVTVRAATDAAVLRLSPRRLETLYETLPDLREFFRQRQDPHLQLLVQAMKAREAAIEAQAAQLLGTAGGTNSATPVAGPSDRASAEKPEKP